MGRSSRKNKEKKMRGQRRNSPPSKPTIFADVWCYFVGFRETHKKGVVRLRNMILTVPGSIRENEQIRKIEAYIADEAKKIAREHATGPAGIGDFDVEVTILNLALLEVYQVPLSPEDERKVRAKNEEILRQYEMNKKVDEIVEDLKQHPPSKKPSSGDAS